MIGMTRAHITDPHIVRKIMAGREDQIRPCVGANYCLDRICQGGAAYCIHNGATGREETIALIYDDAGDHAALRAAEIIAAAGGRVEIMTPDRSFAPEVMATNLVPYTRSLQRQDVTFTVICRLESASRSGNQLRAKIGSDYGGVSKERLVNQIVVNHGTIPLDGLYFELKPLSRNLGPVDHDALIAGWAQTLEGNPRGVFQLFRIGDAVAARNTHAAIYDALRLLKDF